MIQDEVGTLSNRAKVVYSGEGGEVEKAEEEERVGVDAEEGE